MIGTCLVISFLTIVGTEKQKVVIENQDTGSVTTLYYNSLEELRDDQATIDKEVVDASKQCNNAAR